MKQGLFRLTAIICLILAVFKWNDSRADAFESFHDYRSQNGYQCMAEAMFFEGAKDGKIGMHLIGNVIINRYTDKVYEFKNLDSICDVVHQPSRNPARPWECAFSYYCDGKPEVVPETPVDMKAMSEAMWLSQKLLTQLHETGSVIDLTDGALYYTQPQVNRNWMKNTVVTIEYLGHLFRKPIEQE